VLPVPSDVLLLVTVGFAVVLQQTPLAVIAAPPSELMVPPEVAVVDVIEVTGVVVTVEGAAEVVKGISRPYPVPTLLVA